MKTKKNKCVLLVPLLVILSHANVQAQDSVNASGGDASSASGSLAYSIGQINYTSVSNGSITVTQGVQQTYQITDVTGLNTPHISLELLVYPNPAQNYVNLTLANFSSEDKNYFTLNDALGKEIKSQTINSFQTQISVQDIANGIYFLSVYDGNSEIKKFKIVKN